MNSPHSTHRLGLAGGSLAERSSPRSPRLVSGVKIHQPVVASNRAFIRAWAARRAKQVKAGESRPIQ